MNSGSEQWPSRESGSWQVSSDWGSSACTWRLASWLPLACRCHRLPEAGLGHPGTWGKPGLSSAKPSSPRGAFPQEAGRPECQLLGAWDWTDSENLGTKGRQVEVVKTEQGWWQGAGLGEKRTQALPRLLLVLLGLAYFWISLFMSLT